MNAEVHTLIGAYVLDAVDDLERAAVERHLTSCPDCAADVAELREVATRLGTAAAAPAPAGLRERVLSEVARTRQEPLGRRTAVGVDLARWRSGTAAAVAACLVAVGGGVAAWSVQQQRVTAERAETRIERQRADAEREKAELAASREAAIAAVLAADDAVVRDAAVAGGGRVLLVASARLDRAVVVLSELEAVRPGRAYQLWLITGDAPRSAGVLPAGATSATHLLDSLSGADLLALTVEPAAGSPQPTTDPVVAVPLR
ncbi:MAG: anti-sigma factor [Micromonosporaceae bacterium]